MSGNDVSTMARLVEGFDDACVDDPELRLAVRHWTGGLRFEIGSEVFGLTVVDGVMTSGAPDVGPGVISVVGPPEVWAPLFEPTPPPFAQISVLVSMGDAGLRRSPTDPLLWWQYLPAVERAAELLRKPGKAERQPMVETKPVPHHDAPSGGYVHISVDGLDHRIYYEEAGQGIPLLLQHTAGGQSVQWRHLFEMPEITDHFRLIAYDLPFHGKSIPPVGKRWWEEEYKLEGGFLRQVPVGLASALDLDGPVFMGCSVGGLLAIDLALHHPDVFRSVISVEGALHIGGDWDSLLGLWHPQVSNQTKARMMEALCAPTSPETYIKEVSQVYSAGWPAAFLGDLWYYMVDFDLRDRASEIDTNAVGVHILNGEYDWSGTVAGGKAAHEAIPGSTHAVMANMGHFPMQENPLAFAAHLAPILDQIRKNK